MTLNENDKVQIKQVLRSITKDPRFVEFYSQNDNRNHIMNAERFCDIFGYSIEELKEIHNEVGNKL